MAKKKTHHKRPGFTLPIAVVGGLLPGMTNAFAALNKYGFQGMSVQVSRDYLGYDPLSRRFHAPLLWGGTGPLLIGLVVHRIASIIGVNRALGRARIPFVRI